MTEKYKRLTLMVRVDDTARADIALTPERTYYRFATDSSIEDGELAALPGKFSLVVQSLIDDVTPLQGETPLPRDVRLQVFVNNTLHPLEGTEQGLRRLVDALERLYSEFSFLKGFC